MPQPQYDLAISLLERDAAVGKLVYDRLSPQFNVFFYTENQKELEFRNGLEILSEIYRRGSKAVLTLLRPEWGETRWTRLEESAIQSRVSDEGPLFLMAVPMEQMQVPAWIPPTYIYREWERWGPDMFVGSVLAKLADVRAEIRELSAIQIAAERERRAQWGIERAGLLRGESASAFETEFTALQNDLRIACSEMGSISSSAIQFRAGNRSAALQRNPLSVYIRESSEMVPQPLKHAIAVVSFDGLVDERGRTVSRAAAKTSELHYALDVHANGDWFWKDIDSDKSFTTAFLSEQILKEMFARLEGLESGKLQSTVIDRDVPFPFRGRGDFGATEPC